MNRTLASKLTAITIAAAAACAIGGAAVMSAAAAPLDTWEHAYGAQVAVGDINGDLTPHIVFDTSTKRVRNRAITR